MHALQRFDFFSSKLVILLLKYLSMRWIISRFSLLWYLRFFPNKDFYYPISAHRASPHERKIEPSSSICVTPGSWTTHGFFLLPLVFRWLNHKCVLWFFAKFSSVNQHWLIKRRSNDGVTNAQAVYIPLLCFVQEPHSKLRQQTRPADPKGRRNNLKHFANA